MGILKRGNNWQADVRVKGIRHRKAFKSHDEAEKWLQATKFQLKHNIPMPKESWTLKKAQDQCMKIEWENKRSERTNLLNIRMMNEFFGTYNETLDEYRVDHVDLNSIDTETVNEFFIHCRDIKKNKDSTINRKLACLSKIMQFAFDSERLAKMPKFPRQKEPQGRLRFLTKEEEVRILDYFKKNSPSIYDFTVVALDTGFRKSELLNLEDRDIVDEKLMLWENKSDVERSIIMTPRVKEIVYRRLKYGHPFSYKIFSFSKYVVRTAFENMGKDLNLPDVTPHVLRHTFGTRLAKLRVPLKNIKTLMGHRVSSTTERYMHLAPEDNELDMNLLAKEYGSCVHNVTKTA